MVNIALFCATRRILPVRSVVLGWRGLFRLPGFTEIKPSGDADKSFACGGTETSDLEKGDPDDEEPMSSRPDLLDDPHGPPRVRIKIDNHIDNTLLSGENRDSVLDGDRNTLPSLHLAVPLPALVREERRKDTESGLKTIG